jgi:hypothetical protein
MSLAKDAVDFAPFHRHHLPLPNADVTEGSGGIWERLHYDWSDPNRVVLKTIDSNAWGGASGQPTPSRVSPMARPTLTWSFVHEGKNLKGWMLGLASGPSAGAFWKRR